MLRLRQYYGSCLACIAVLSIRAMNKQPVMEDETSALATGEDSTPHIFLSTDYTLWNRCLTRE